MRKAKCSGLGRSPDEPTLRPPHGPQAFTSCTPRRASGDGSRPMTANDPPEWVLLYDGPCALCQGAVQWIMARDRAQLFCYSPLQGPWAASWKACYAPSSDWPDEVVLIGGNQHWVGADAVALVWRKLPFPYPILGWAYRILPGRKKIYRWLAQHRYTWFGKKEELLTTCPAPRSWREPRPHSC